MHHAPSMQTEDMHAYTSALALSRTPPPEVACSAAQTVVHSTCANAPSRGDARSLLGVPARDAPMAMDASMPSANEQGPYSFSFRLEELVQLQGESAGVQTPACRS